MGVRIAAVIGYAIFGFVAATFVLSFTAVNSNFGGFLVLVATCVGARLGWTRWNPTRRP